MSEDFNIREKELEFVAAFEPRDGDLHIFGEPDIFTVIPDRVHRVHTHLG